MGYDRYAMAGVDAFQISLLIFTYIAVAQLFIGGTLSNVFGRVWALRISIAIMIIGV